MNGTYIHYGHDSFDKELFNPIKNSSWQNKPRGGLWSSPIDSERGWRNWCEGEGFRLDKLNDHFTFTIKDTARVLRIDNKDNLDDIPILHKDRSVFPNEYDYYLDFKKITKDYDAILFDLTSDPRLYWSMYGWDVDTLLVLNPDIVEEVE